MAQTNHYILQGGPENIKYWEQPDRYGMVDWFWSANKHVLPGDKAFIYLTAPLSRIVGVVDILKEPFYNPREASMFLNRHMLDRWCVEVGNPFYFGNRDDLSMANLRKLFGTDWGWVRYPRGNTRVPDEILPPLLELIGDMVSIRIRGSEFGE